jgi:hypothetical protein
MSNYYQLSASETLEKLTTDLQISGTYISVSV